MNSTKQKLRRKNVHPRFYYGVGEQMFFILAESNVELINFDKNGI